MLPLLGVPISAASGATGAGREAPKLEVSIGVGCASSRRSVSVSAWLLSTFLASIYSASSVPEPEEGTKEGAGVCAALWRPRRSASAGKDFGFTDASNLSGEPACESSISLA